MVERAERGGIEESHRCNVIHSHSRKGIRIRRYDTEKNGERNRMCDSMYVICQ